MRIQKAFALSFNILMHSKLRSWLTIVGIVIGVAAVVAITSLGAGLQANVASRLGTLGADIITLSPGGGGAQGGFRGGFGGGGDRAATTSSAKNITDKDIQLIKGAPNVKVVSGLVSGRADLYFNGEKVTASVQGIHPTQWLEVTTLKIDQGRFLGPSDSNMIVIGGSLAKGTFKKEIGLNQLVVINDKSFKVVGILAVSGTGGGADNSVIMPITMAREVVENIGPDKYNSVQIKVLDVNLIDDTLATIDSKLSILRQVSGNKKDYTLTSAKETQANIQAVTGTITLFLGAIAAVSLLVGAIGIANTMFTSVLEKTKEIGIMKAIGARNGDILMIFLFNSALVGMVGGLLGILLGVIVSGFMPLLGLRFGPGGSATNAVISVPFLFISLGISVFIGIIAGMIPAYRASKLKPVDALRYE